MANHRAHFVAFAEEAEDLVLANLIVGFRGRRNFHQVEPFFLGQLNGLKRLHDAELAALIINHPDFASADSLVHANAVGLPEAAFCDKSPSSTSLFAARKRLTSKSFRRQIQGMAPSSQPTPHGAKQP